MAAANPAIGTASFMWLSTTPLLSPSFFTSSKPDPTTTTSATAAPLRPRHLERITTYPPLRYLTAHEICPLTWRLNPCNPLTYAIPHPPPRTLRASPVHVPGVHLHRERGGARIIAPTRLDRCGGWQDLDGRQGFGGLPDTPRSLPRPICGLCSVTSPPHASRYTFCFPM